MKGVGPGKRSGLGGGWVGVVFLSGSRQRGKGDLDDVGFEETVREGVVSCGEKMGLFFMVGNRLGIMLFDVSIEFRWGSQLPSLGPNLALAFFNCFIFYPLPTQ